MAKMKTMKISVLEDSLAKSISKKQWCLYWNIDIKEIITSKPNHVKPGDRYYDFEEEQWKIK